MNECKPLNTGTSCDGGNIGDRGGGGGGDWVVPSRTLKRLCEVGRCVLPHADPGLTALGLRACS